MRAFAESQKKASRAALRRNNVRLPLRAPSSFRRNRIVLRLPQSIDAPPSASTFATPPLGDAIDRRLLQTVAVPHTPVVFVWRDAACHVRHVQCDCVSIACVLIAGVGGAHAALCAAGAKASPGFPQIAQPDEAARRHPRPQGAVPHQREAGAAEERGTQQAASQLTNNPTRPPSLGPRCVDGRPRN